jgi:Terpene synthase family 2, C-terminal metal binding
MLSFLFSNAISHSLGFSFRARFLLLAGPRNVKRFINLWEKYLDAVAKEAELRERGQVLDLESFIPLRRNNSAILLCFSMIEYILGIDLEDEVYEDPTFLDAYWAACDHVCWANVCFINTFLTFF